MKCSRLVDASAKVDLAIRTTGFPLEVVFALKKVTSKVFSKPVSIALGVRELTLFYCSRQFN